MAEPKDSKTPPAINTNGKAVLDLDSKTQSALYDFEDALLQKMSKSDSKDVLRDITKKALNGEVSAEDIKGLSSESGIAAIQNHASLEEAMKAAGITHTPGTQPATKPADATKDAKDFAALDPKEGRVLTKFADAVNGDANIPEDTKKQLIAVADNQLQKRRISVEQLEALSTPKGMEDLDASVKAHNGHVRIALDKAIETASGESVKRASNSQEEADNSIGGNPHISLHKHSHHHAKKHDHAEEHPRKHDEPAHDHPEKHSRGHGHHHEPAKQEHHDETHHAKDQHPRQTEALAELTAALKKDGITDKAAGELVTMARMGMQTGNIMPADIKALATEKGMVNLETEMAKTSTPTGELQLNKALKAAISDTNGKTAEHQAAHARNHAPEHAHKNPLAMGDDKRRGVFASDVDKALKEYNAQAKVNGQALTDEQMDAIRGGVTKLASDGKHDDVIRTEIKRIHDDADTYQRQNLGLAQRESDVAKEKQVALKTEDKDLAKGEQKNIEVEGVKINTDIEKLKAAIGKENISLMKFAVTNASHGTGETFAPNSAGGEGPATHKTR